MKLKKKKNDLIKAAAKKHNSLVVLEAAMNDTVAQLTDINLFRLQTSDTKQRKKRI